MKRLRIAEDSYAAADRMHPLLPLLHRMEDLFSVLVPYQRSAAFTPLQCWTSAERLRIHEPRASADDEAASRPRSFGKALNTYGWRRGAI